MHVVLIVVGPMQLWSFQYSLQQTVRDIVSALVAIDVMYWADFHQQCRAFLHSNEQPYSHLDFVFGRFTQHRFSPAVRRQQLDATCDSHRIHHPSSPSCCNVPSSSASLIICDSDHRCRLDWNLQQSVLFFPIARATVFTHRWSIRFSASLRSAQSITRPMFLESRILVSRSRPPAISAGSETKLWYRKSIARVHSRSRVAR